MNERCTNCAGTGVVVCPVCGGRGELKYSEAAMEEMLRWYEAVKSSDPATAIYKLAKEHNELCDHNKELEDRVKRFETAAENCIGDEFMTCREKEKALRDKIAELEAALKPLAYRHNNPNPLTIDEQIEQSENERRAADALRAELDKEKDAS